MTFDRFGRGGGEEPSSLVDSSSNAASPHRRLHVERAAADIFRYEELDISHMHHDDGEELAGGLFSYFLWLDDYVTYYGSVRYILSCIFNFVLIRI